MCCHHFLKDSSNIDWNNYLLLYVMFHLVETTMYKDEPQLMCGMTSLFLAILRVTSFIFSRSIVLSLITKPDSNLLNHLSKPHLFDESFVLREPTYLCYSGVDLHYFLGCSGTHKLDAE